MKTILVVSLLSLLLLTTSVAAQCLEYQPKTVHLSGKLVREIHPGPPNYENIRKGDKAETIWVLRLSLPICVVAMDDINVREDNQKEVQLDLAAEQFKKYRKLIGQKVFATGFLFHAHTGHHHKRLLLTLNEMRRTR
jgi:hypothetical protein